MNAARGPGDYHGTMSKTELEQEAGGSIFNAPAGTETRDQVENTRYQGSSVASGSSSSGSSYSGEGEDYVTTSRGRWVWEEENKKWVWEEGNVGGGGGAAAGAGSQSQGQQQSYSANQQQQQNSASGGSDSGWTQLPNGQYVRKVSNWSSQQSGSSYQSGGGGGARAGGSNADYFESGNIGYRQEGAAANGGNRQSGNRDSGWVQLPNGTYVRQQESWSSSSSVMSGGRSGANFAAAGYGAGSVLPSAHEHGDDGSNSTGWMRQPDGTMVMRNSAWSSWSSSGQ